MASIANTAVVAKPAPRRTPPRPPKGKKLALAAGAGGLLLMLGILIITIRNKDGKETTIRIPDGVVADIDVQPGSKVSIREEASGASDAGDPAGMTSAVGAERDLQSRSGNNVQKEVTSLASDKPKLWPVGPLPSWTSEEPRWSIMKESLTIPGAVERPTEFKKIGRWNVDTVHSRGLIQVARYSPDSKWLATGSSDGHVRIFEASTMKLHQLLPGIGGGVGVGDLSWHPDSQRIAVAADNERTLRIWTLQGRLLLEELMQDRTSISAVAWTFDGGRLICGGENRLELRNADGTLLKSLIDGQQIPGCYLGNIAVSPNSQRFVCWHRDAARIWNSETSKVEHTIDIAFSYASLSRIRWSKKDQIFLGLRDRLVICSADGNLLKDFQSESLCAAAWRPDGEHLTIWRDNLYDLNSESGESTAADKRVYVSPESGVIPTAIDWSPDGKRLVVAAGCLAVSNEALNRIEFNSGATLSRVSGISLNRSGTRISSVGDNDNCVRN